MTRGLLLGLVMSVVLFPLLTPCAASMYWDPDEQHDAAITSKDFRLDWSPLSNRASRGGTPIYDRGPDTDQQIEPPAETPRPAARPRRAPAAEPRTRAPRTTRPRARTAPSPSRIRGVDTAPRATQRTTEAKSEAKPAKKKLRWGKVDMDSPVPKVKFEWGSKK